MTGPLAGRSILVLEDEMLVLMHIETALTDLGCNATSVGTTDAALKVRTAPASMPRFSTSIFAARKAIRWPTRWRCAESRSSSRPVTATTASVPTSPTGRC